MKTIDISCPCCKATLVIDPETGNILHQKKYKEPPKSLDEFLKTEKNKSADLAAKFQEGREKEESKQEYLDKKFQWAKDNEDQLPEPPKPDIFFD